MSLGFFETLQRTAGDLGVLEHPLVDRALAQIEFAQGFTELLRGKAAGWQRLIDRACQTLQEALAASGVAGIDAAVAQAEQILAPIGKVAKTYTIHCAGHGHIDMNWMWSWPETVAVTNDTFLTVLKLMDEFPDFCYTQSQASVYRIAQQYNPELFERIKARVKEGRWEVAASHWVEGDKNLAAGEALARHLLYTRRFMKEHLGLTPDDVPIDWSPDTFGHAITIPAIDSRGGVKYYYMCRGGDGSKPPVFWYRSPDGSKILVNRETTWYNGRIDTRCAIAMLAFCRQTGLRDWLKVYGVGDHGGGPTRRDILRCHEMNSWPIYPTLKFTTVRDYYRILAAHGKEWPVIDRELNFEFTGCYTTQTQIKRNNRLGENYMLEAELAATLATRIVNAEYPSQTLRDQWIDVLFSHFHDILPGSGVAETRQYNQGLFQKVAAAAGMIKTNALRAIAARIDTSFAGRDTRQGQPAKASLALGAGVGRNTYWGEISDAGHVVDGPRPFIVFNPTAWPRRQVVRACVWDTDTGSPAAEPNARAFVVRSADGRRIPAQKISDGHYWGHTFVDLVFPAEVAGLGYNTYVIEEGTVKEFVGPVTATESKPCHVPMAPDLPRLENEFLVVEFDSLTGGVKTLIDKRSGQNLADPASPLGTLEYVLERPWGMSAWVIAPPQQIDWPLPAYSMVKTQEGPFQAAVQTKLKIKDSDATITYTLKAGEPMLEISIQVHWTEIGGKDKGTPCLRMRFPLALSQASSLCEVPFGSIERHWNQGEEIPALRWIDVTGRPVAAKATPRKGTAAGVALANDCKYGYSLTDNVLRATLIRSSYDPDLIPEVGDHTIRFAVMPHGARPATADLVRMGAALNHPLQVVATDAHEGKLRPAAEGLTVVPANVVLTSLKKAEDGNGFVIRLQETAGKAAVAKVAVCPALLGKVSEAVEADLLERPVARSSARATAEGLSVKMAPHGITSVRIAFEK